MGKCPSCGEWGSLVEMVLERESKRAGGRKRKAIKPQKLAQIASVGLKRLSTKIGELDRVLGGGIVPGSVVLVAGEPGIGKSTLLLQLVAKVGGLYISGEESLGQLKIRAQRLKINSLKAQFLAETQIDSFLPSLADLKPVLVVADSIQALFTADLSGVAGSDGHQISQKRKNPGFFSGSCD